MTPEEIAAFSEKMKPVHAEFADKIGADLLQTTYKEIDALAE